MNPFYFRNIIVALALAGSGHGANGDAGSPATMRVVNASCRPSSSMTSTLTSSTDSEVIAEQVAQAQSELEVAERLVKALSTVESARWIQDYMNTLHNVVTSAQAHLEASQEHLIRFAPSLALQLKTARISLLDEAPTAKRWMALARIISPGQRLPVPRRYVGKAAPIDNELDIHAIKTGAWVRAWHEGNTGG